MRTENMNFSDVLSQFAWAAKLNNACMVVEGDGKGFKITIKRGKKVISEHIVRPVWKGKIEIESKIY